MSKIDFLLIDQVDVYRTVQSDDGFGGVVERFVKVYENIPCRLSQKTLSNTDNAANRVSVQGFALFCDVSIDILQNDILEIYRGGKTKYKALAMQPFIYNDLIPHKEIVLEQVIENGY